MIMPNANLALVVLPFLDRRISQLFVLEFTAILLLFNLKDQNK